MSRNSAIKGETAVPGDKSVSHRALIFSALAPGTSAIGGLNTGEDVRSTAGCLRSLGAEVSWLDDEATAVVTGPAGGLTEPFDVLDVGNSGTTIRTLLGVTASVPGISVLSGDGSVRSRPMMRVVGPLRAMGADIEGRAGGTLAPLVVRGRDLRGLDHTLSVASAQVKTALVLAGLAASGTTRVVEPGPSRDHTERMLAARGVRVNVRGREVSVQGAQRPEPLDHKVPGDLSSAFFLIVAALLLPGSDLTLTGVGLNPTRLGGLEVLRMMGADLSWDVETIEGGEPVGSIHARHSALHGVVVDPDIVPTLIDEVPALAVAASQAEGATVVTGASELRVKESDRIEGIVQGLSSIGAEVEALDDGLVVRGPSSLRGGVVSSLGDHRLAMSFAVAGMVAKGDVKVQGWSAVGTSFPEFVGLVRSLRGRR